MSQRITDDVNSKEQGPSMSAATPPGHQKAKSVGEQQASGQSGLKAYLQGVASEWRKITWPTVPQIWAQTLVVLIVVAILTAAIWGVDSLFAGVIQLITPVR